MVDIDLNDMRAEYRSADLDDEQPFTEWAEETLTEALEDAIDYRRWEEEFAKMELSEERPSRGTPMPDVDLSEAGEF